MKLRNIGNTFLDGDVSKFRDRKVKAKNIFEIRVVDKVTAYDFVKKYHYLKDAKFFCVYACGLFHKRTNTLVGVATYSNPQGIVALKGWFGETNQNKDIMELSRLCMLPPLNKTNATSYLLGNSMKIIHREFGVRAVITLADSIRHVGSIYQVCNFKYYGLTDSKSDFCMVGYKPNARVGTTKDKHGVWIPRSRKHRYAYIMDSTLEVLYDEQPRPSIEDTLLLECCGGTKRVYDKRFNEWYTCPRCCEEFKKIEPKKIKLRKRL